MTFSHRLHWFHRFDFWWVYRVVVSRRFRRLRRFDYGIGLGWTGLEGFWGLLYCKKTLSYLASQKLSSRLKFSRHKCKSGVVTAEITFTLWTNFLGSEDSWRLSLTDYTYFTDLIFDNQNRRFTQITQIWFMIVLKCRHESYVPQKLSPGLKFSKHKCKSGVVTAEITFTLWTNSFGSEDSWRLSLTDYTYFTDLIFDNQNRRFTQISQIWFMIVLKCRHESYVPQKLSPRLKFSRHKWLLTYIEGRKRRGRRFSGKYPSHYLDLKTSRPLDLKTSRPLDLKTSRPLDLKTSHYLAKYILTISLSLFFSL